MENIFLECFCLQTWEANKGKANDDAINMSFQLSVVQKNQ